MFSSAQAEIVREEVNAISMWADQLAKIGKHVKQIKVLTMGVKLCMQQYGKHDTVTKQMKR